LNKTLTPQLFLTFQSNETIVK